MKKTAAFLISLIILMAGFAMPAFAEDIEQEAIDDTLVAEELTIEITTDSKKYDAQEEIETTISFTSHHAVDITITNLWYSLPDGYTIMFHDDISQNTLDTLSPEETKTVTLSYVPDAQANESAMIPPVYLAGAIALVVALLAIIALLIFAKKRKANTKAAVSLLLLFGTIFATVSLLQVEAKAEEGVLLYIEREFETSKVIQIDKEDVSLHVGGAYEYPEQYYNVTFDYNDTQFTNTTVTVLANSAIEAPAAPEKDGFVFVGWYPEDDEAYAEWFDFETAVAEQDIVLLARWIDLVDTDEDGLIDYLEEYYGTDKTMTDTDGDGLSDYIETQELYLDPLLIDTDGNGIEDGDEDGDADSLSNLEELELGTNPMMFDSDWDGLGDGEEDDYGTLRLVYDTDEDGVSDGREVALGTDPLVAEESFEITLVSTEEDSVSVSVEVTLSGEQVESLQIDKIVNDLLFPQTMPGAIGSAYDFSVDGEFESAVISFSFDSELLENEAFEPVIYYFNEEDQWLEPLETVVVDNTAYATITHFSTYKLLEKGEFNDAFMWRDVWETDLPEEEEEEVVRSSISVSEQQLDDVYTDDDDDEGIDIDTDSDKDGIPDYYEENLVYFNGERIKLEKEQNDTDKDGLLDGDEIKIVYMPNEDGTKMTVIGKMLSDPTKVDSDGDGINDGDCITDDTRSGEWVDPEPMVYNITDKTLALVCGLSYTNLEWCIGRTVGDAIDAGQTFNGISTEDPEDVEILRDAIVIAANNSSWDDSYESNTDGGLGSLTLKFTNTATPSIIYALRGTEFDENGWEGDFSADILLGFGISSIQSEIAIAEYCGLTHTNDANYYITGHSLGGRLAQDVLYDIYKEDDENVRTPVHSATFNALGYNVIEYEIKLSTVFSKYQDTLSNFYYSYDIVGTTFGNYGLFTRPGTDIELRPQDKDGKALPLSGIVNLVYHGIEFFHADYALQYENEHSFPYWFE